VIGIGSTGMTTRHLLARIAAVVTAAAMVGILAGPAGASAADRGTNARADRHAESADDQPSERGGRTDADADPSFATAFGIGTLLDGWATRDLDIGPAMAQAQFGSILDGWGNRDMDFGAFSSAMNEAQFGSILDGWGNRDMDFGAF
jgi:hypothetical protein